MATDPTSPMADATFAAPAPFVAAEVAADVAAEEAAGTGIT